MIPLPQQLQVATARLNALRREVGRNQGEAREKYLKEIEAQEAIVETLNKCKMLKEVGDEMVAEAMKGEVKVV